MFKNKDKIKGKLAIFAGRGNLPKILIAECLKNKQEFCLFLLEGEHYQNDYNQYNPITVPYGAIEKFLAIIKEKEIKEIIFIGAVNKPNFNGAYTPNQYNNPYQINYGHGQEDISWLL